MTALLFAIAAGLGAGGRHAVNLLGRGWRGTLAINVTGSFVLGVLLGADLSASALTVLGTGFCGAFTTFSGLALEVEETSTRTGTSIAVASVVLGVLAAAGGYAIA